MSQDIVLKPSFAYWAVRNIVFVLLIAALLMLDGVYGQYPIFRYVGMIAAVALFNRVFFDYIRLLLVTRWVVSDEQIKFVRGIFVKRVDYIELYRVFDYSESRSIIQSLFALTTIYIHSGDKSHPVLRINGIRRDASIIPMIRERAEAQKKRRGIYEFTNQQ